MSTGDLPEWRAILSVKLEDLLFRARLIAELGVREQTLYRWARGENKPDSKQKVIGLGRLMPEAVESLKQELPQYFISPQDTNLRLVAPFLQRALEARAMVEEGMLLSTITHLALGELVKSLDPHDSIGTMACLAQLCIDDKQKASSLLAHAWSAHGTGIWAERRIQKSYKVGSGSLSAVACVSGDPAFTRDRGDLSPTHGLCNIDHVESAAAYPILSSGRIAGVVFIVSTVADFFDADRRDLSKRFVDMIPLAFHRGNFYSRDQIDFSSTRSAEQQYLDALALEFPAESQEQLKARAVARIQRY